MGFFEREGLDVPIITMRGSPLTIQALTADSIYVANATVDTLIAAYEKGADITMIGGLINGLGLSMIGGKPYKTYADLRGTTIGTQTLTSGTGFALRLVLKAHGLEYPRDYKLISIEHCRYAADYNLKNRIWDRNADLNVEGVRTVIKITAEQGILKEPLPQPSKYIDQSYLKQALAELNKK